MSKAKGQDTSEGNLNVRLILTGTKVKELERACADFKRVVTERKVKVAGSERNLVVRGPVRLPTKVLHITTRKSPCGEGTNTWDRYQMRIHKRLIDVESPHDLIKDITNVTIDPSVQIEVILHRKGAL